MARTAVERLARRRVLALGALLLAACGPADDSAGGEDTPPTAGDPGVFRYNREYVFVAPGAGTPLVVPFIFQASDEGEALEREVRAWLARGPTWDPFLEEAMQTPAAGGVWRIVPQGNLRVTAGGPAELEALRFSEGERRLRLDIEGPLGDWNQGGNSRFRLLGGRLTVGAESFSGPVLETLRIDRMQPDGWPAGTDLDAMFLISGDSIQMVLARNAVAEGEEADGYAWTRTGGVERTWDIPEIVRLALEPYQDARRDIPTRWSFRIPSAGIDGQLEAAGYDASLGPERGGRRTLEIRYTVEGTITLDGEPRPVSGMLRHTQP